MNESDGTLSLNINTNQSLVEDTLCGSDDDPTPEKVIKTVGYTTVILISLLGNSLLIYAVNKNHRLKTVTYHLILNMAVADILVTVCNVPGRLARQITGRYHWLGGIPGIIICKSASFISDSTVSCAILTLTAIALDRFCVVKFPFKKIISLKRVKFLIALIWLLSFIAVSPLLYAMRVQKINGVIYCYEDWSPLFDRDQAPKVYTVVMFVLLYAVPLLFISVFYSIVVYKVWIRKIPDECRSNRAAEQDARKNVLMMLILLVVIFALCWLPLHISLFFYFFQADKYACGIPEGGFSIASVGLFLSHATSAINPCLYVAFNKDIRKGFKDGICACCSLCA